MNEEGKRSRRKGADRTDRRMDGYSFYCLRCTLGEECLKNKRSSKIILFIIMSVGRSLSPAKSAASLAISKAASSVRRKSIIVRDKWGNKVGRQGLFYIANLLSVRIPSGSRRLCCRSGKYLEIPNCLLQTRRRYNTFGC